MLKGASMTSAKQSPTVVFSEKQDPDWFEKNGGDYGYGNNPDSAYDNHGYDKAGYNKEGFDRAGVHENQYTEELYREVLEDFDGVCVSDLDSSLRSSEYESLNIKEKELLAEKRRVEQLLKKINEDLEAVAQQKTAFGMSDTVSGNVVAPKRGFGR